MNDNLPRDQTHSAIVDDALRTHPLKPAPPGLLPRVMTRVREQSRAPRFRLAWIDFAATLFAGCMITLIVVLFNSMPPQVAARFETELMLLAQRAYVPGGVVLILAGVLAGCMLTLAAWLFSRRRRVSSLD